MYEVADSCQRDSAPQGRKSSSLLQVGEKEFRSILRNTRK